MYLSVSIHTYTSLFTLHAHTSSFMLTLNGGGRCVCLVGGGGEWRGGEGGEGRLTAHSFLNKPFVVTCQSVLLPPPSPQTAHDSTQGFTHDSTFTPWGIESQGATITCWSGGGGEWRGTCNLPLRVTPSLDPSCQHASDGVLFLFPLFLPMALYVFIKDHDKRLDTLPLFL